MFAASALAANTFMRSILGAIFPLFATYMFDGESMNRTPATQGVHTLKIFTLGIGINWGMTLVACVATVLAPTPFVFYFYGKKIRARSKFAPAPDIELDKKKTDDGDEKV